MASSEFELRIALTQATRRADLLAAAAEVSHAITQLTDLDALLLKTVDIICEAYGFYYAGIFLLDEAGEWAILRAGRGEPGRIMMANKHKLMVGSNSMIGFCTARNTARIASAVDREDIWYPDPLLPATRSEMALPLSLRGRVIGALSVHSREAAAFSDEDIASLQAMANQLAIAIDNARQQRELAETQAELLRAKTYQAIATATGDAIHWIGNKADPIHDSVERLRTDLQVLICLAADLLTGSPAEPSVHLIHTAATALRQARPNLNDVVSRLKALPPDTLTHRFDLDSLFEDLDLIDDAAAMILTIKEKLIGPAREQAPRPTMADDVLQDTLTRLHLPTGLVKITRADTLPLVRVDPLQLSRVFTNLIQNAVEATTDTLEPSIGIDLQPDESGSFVEVTIYDNGGGIAPEEMDKIWVTFHTTKGPSGHPGLGLPASRLILEQIGGHIRVASPPGQGAIFTVGLPVAVRPMAPPPPAHRRARLLLIDDNDGWRHFAAGALKAAGHSVTLADPGQPGWTGGYDLILIDDVLTGQNSGTVLTALKTAGSVDKAVVVSSSPRVEQAKRWVLLGVKDFVPKPYTAAELLALIDTLFN
ncbi:MAG TPA: ATP-binding protein [Anaerolineae bacterium]|nr:ATP-binding protein [Anaerolineae bacterium]